VVTAAGETNLSNQSKMILTILFSIALDTLPVQPIRVILPRPVKSQTVKPKQDDKTKNGKTGNADDGGRRIAPIRLVNR
jgi:hypothetical protein